MIIKECFDAVFLAIKTHAQISDSAFYRQSSFNLMMCFHSRSRWCEQKLGMFRCLFTREHKVKCHHSDKGKHETSFHTDFCIH